MHTDTRPANPGGLTAEELVELTPAKLEPLSGKEQKRKAGEELEPLIVKVVNGNGMPLSLIPVEFKLVEGKGRFEHCDSHTGMGGEAVAEFVPEGDGRFRVECVVGNDQRLSMPFVGMVEKKPRRRAAAKKTATEAPKAAAPPPPPPPAEDPAVPQAVPQAAPIPPPPKVAEPARRAETKTTSVARKAFPTHLVLAALALAILAVILAMILQPETVYVAPSVIDCSGATGHVDGTTLVYEGCVPGR